MISLFCGVNFILRAEEVQLDRHNFKRFKIIKLKSINNNCKNDTSESCGISTFINVSTDQKLNQWYPEITLRLKGMSEVFCEVAGRESILGRFIFYKKEIDIPVTVRTGGNYGMKCDFSNTDLFFVPNVFVQYIFYSATKPEKISCSHRYKFTLKAYFAKVPMMFNFKLIELIPQSSDIVIAEIEGEK